MAVSSVGDTYFTNYSADATDAVSDRVTNQIQNAGTDEEMLDACKQFEEYMIQQMLRMYNKAKKMQLLQRFKRDLWQKKKRKLKKLNQVRQKKFNKYLFKFR